MGSDNLPMAKTVRGEVRLPDPVDDAILTLGVRMRSPLPHAKIASLFGIARDEVSRICQPYEVFLQEAGEDGPGLVYTGQSDRQAVRPRGMWEDAAFGNSGRDSFRKQQVVNGADRLADPVDDAILTLGVRTRNPLSYAEIASLFDISGKSVRKICQPYKEFMRQAGEYGVRGVTYTGRDSN